MNSTGASRRTSSVTVPLSASSEPFTAIRTVIVDDQRVFAEALSSRLELEGRVLVVGGFEPPEAPIHAIEAHRADVVIVDFDIHSADAAAAAQLIGTLRARRPGVGVVAVIEHEDPKAAARAVRAGARGVVPRTAPLSDIVDAVRAVRAGGSWIPPRLLTAVLESLARPAREGLREPLDRLTARELDVLRELAAGHDRKVIGERLSISVNTLRTHIKHIFGKLGVHSTLNAVTVAINAGLEMPVELTPDEGTQRR